LSKGVGRAFSKPVVELLRRVAREDHVNALIAAKPAVTGLDFIEHVLHYLEISYSVVNTDRENIPAEGPVVIVANHPLGALDALTLIHLISSVRRDVQVLANDILMQVSQLTSFFLPLPVVGSGNALGGTREAYRALENGHALVVFPSGEVSRIRPQGVRDQRWTSGFARLALKTGAPVLPVHISAQNSPVFYGVSMLAKPLAMLLLTREMMGAVRTQIGMQIGQLVPASALAESKLSLEQIAKYMRRHVYHLPRRRPAEFQTSVAVAQPEAPEDVHRALQNAEVLGQTTDGKQILLLEAEGDCAALREIGRLRELAFRSVGEGTGARRDLDHYDDYYQHLVLWDEAALAIAGAYRLGESAPIIRERGLDGLYSASLFEYSEQAASFLEQGVELGRSFVQPAYWGSRSLDYLWQGIGAYLLSRPHLRYLYGPVSLSASLPLAAREWIVDYHRHYYSDAEHLARARNPFVISDEVAAQAHATWQGRNQPEGFTALREQLAAMNASLPVLYRQYADLCEPEGVRFMAFGIDPAFGGCVDGLVRLDMNYLRPAKRARYMRGQGSGVRDQGSVT
jgi:putative hemolysin